MKPFLWNDQNVIDICIENKIIYSMNIKLTVTSLLWPTMIMSSINDLLSMNKTFIFYGLTAHLLLSVLS